MTFVSFVAMLQQKALWFTRLDELAKSDPYEGQPPFRKWLKDTQGAEELDIYVNCWHLLPYQSAAMWKVYGSGETGIAIKSTVGQLEDSIQQKVLAWPVEYLDNEAWSPNRPALVDLVQFGPDLPQSAPKKIPSLVKRRSFEYEHELRVCFARKAGLNNPKGLSVPSDLSGLIEAVYISPLAADWQAEAVKGVLSKYNLRQIPVTHCGVDAPELA